MNNSYMFPPYNNFSNYTDFWWNYSLVNEYSSAENSSDFRWTYFEDESEEIFIFDRTDVGIIFVTLYVLVFCCCFFGNLLIILVVTLSRRLRSITNFFLANLAVADLCVGIFCVLQNLSIYLIPSWVLGDFLCKMYQFVHSLSYTASIFILVVICTERYFAIIHPITCKQILTPSRLKLVMVAVWITSAVYSSPKFIWVQTITNTLPDGRSETICIQHQKRYNAELFDVVNFALLYVTPLCVMTVLYTRIAIGLWRSSNGLQPAAPSKTVTSNGTALHTAPCRSRSGTYDYTNSQPIEGAESPILHRNTRSTKHHHVTNAVAPGPFTMSASSQNILRARRGVIRMLIAVVLAFALCNLPLHARKMWQHWSIDYRGDSEFSTLFTPLTFLVSYFNSGVNPLLYAFLSRNFRKGMRELLLCSCGTSRNYNKNASSNRLLHSHRNLSKREIPQTNSFVLTSSTIKQGTCGALMNVNGDCNS